MGVFGCALLMALMLMNPGDSARAAGEALRVWALQVTPALYPALCCMLYIAPRLPGRPAVGAVLGILSGSPGGARVCAGYSLNRAAARRLAAGTGVMSPLFFLTVLAGWLQSPLWAARVYICHLVGAWAAALLLPGGGKTKKRHEKRAGKAWSGRRSAPGSRTAHESGQAVGQEADGHAHARYMNHKNRRKTDRIAFFSRMVNGREDAQRREDGAARSVPGQPEAPDGGERAENGRENAQRREEGAARPVPGLFDAMSAAAAALLTVAGCIVLGTVASALAGKYLSGAAPWVTAALQSVLEVTGGVCALCALDAPAAVRSVLCAFFTSFGGLPLLMQNSAFWQKQGLGAADLLPLRLLHGALSALMCFLWSRAV